MSKSVTDIQLDKGGLHTKYGPVRKTKKAKHCKLYHHTDHSKLQTEADNLQK